MIILIASLIYFTGAIATAAFVARATVARNATVVSALRTTPVETGLFALAIGALWPIYWPIEFFIIGARAIGKRAEAQQQEPVIIGEEENEPRRPTTHLNR